MVSDRCNWPKIQIRLQLLASNESLGHRAHTTVIRLEGRRRVPYWPSNLQRICRHMPLYVAKTIAAVLVTNTLDYSIIPCFIILPLKGYRKIATCS